MKKSRIFLVLAGITLLFAGCSNLSSGDSAITDGYKSVNANKKTLTINATSADGALTFPVADSGASRTIMADSIDASNVYFYLASWDTLANDNETWVFNTTPLTFTADAGSTTKGSIAETFEVSVYRFTLFACPTNSVSNIDAATTSAYFIGYASADLRYADEITFYLTAENVSGSANVKLSLYSSNTASTDDLWKIPAGYIVRASIRNMNDDTIVPSTVQPQYMLGSTASAGIGAEATLAGAASPAGELAVFTQETVPAGEYSFEVAFIDTKNDNKTYFYTEQIIVLPNQPITKNVFVTDVLEKVPEKPSSFFVAYADPLSKTDDYYYAQFAWSDNSDNERSFVIQLMDISDGIDNTQSPNELTTYKNFAVPVSDDSWEGLWKKITGSSSAYDDTKNITTYEWADYQTSEFNADPSTYSLIKNNKEAMFLFPLGKRYVARIKATNDIGDSDWSYVVIGDQDASHGASTTEKTTGAISDDGTSKYTCTQTILLMDGTTYKTTTADITYTPTSKKLGSGTGGLNLKMLLFPKDSTTDPLSYTVAINRFRVTYQIGDGKFYNKYDTTNTNYDNKGYGADSMAQPVVVSYHTQTIGAAPETASATGTSTTTSTMNKVAILAPFGLNQKYYKASSALTTDEVTDYVYLVENGQLFTRWLLTSTTDSEKFSYESGNRYPYSSTTASAATDFETNFSDYSVSPRVYNMPNGYTGHENIELFASYAVDTTLQVEIADYTSYEWVGFGDVTDSSTTPATTSTVSDISLNGTDSSANPVYFEDYLDGTPKTYCQKGDYVKISVTKSPTVTFTVNETAKGYDTLALQIHRTSSSTYNYKSIKELADDESAGWTAAPASWTVNVKSWKSGVYECKIIGTTSKYPNKAYYFPITLYLVD